MRTNYFDKQRAAGERFIAAICSEDIDAFKKAMLEVDSLPKAWPATVRLAATISSVSEQTKRWFVHVWQGYGEHIRLEADDDIALINALRVLLPSYSGPAVRIFRGDAAFNRRQRTYGISWSGSKQVAEHFALTGGSLHKGGGVLVETVASPDAIICDLEACGADNGEKEFLIDRHRLGRVRLVKKFPQLSLEEVDRIVEEIEHSKPEV